MFKVAAQHILEVEAFWTAVHQCKVVDVEVGFKLRVPEEVVDRNLGHRILLELYDDPYSILAGFVANL